MPETIQRQAPKIIILDDDHYPDGRVSKKLIPEFQKKGLEGLVVHIKTFEDYKEYMDKQENLNDVGLVVMDCSLEDGKKYYSFEQTLPWTVSHFEQCNRYDLIKCVMPASGNHAEGIRNNEYAVAYYNNRGYVMDWQQEGLTSGGLSSNPEKILNRILGFYEFKYPGMLTVEGARKAKESDAAAKPESESQSTNLEAESAFWQQVLEERDKEINGLKSPAENKLHDDMTDKVLTRSLLEGSSEVSRH